MTDLHLPLAEQSDKVDYTTIENIKFSKKISGKERATHIADVFAEYYVKTVISGRSRDTYTEYSVKIEKYTIAVRGYKNIVVCIIGDYSMPGFGPKDRSYYRTRGRLFEEENNKFPFRSVLVKLREMIKADEDILREKEIAEREKEFAIMELEGIAMVEFGLDAKKIIRMDTRYSLTPAIEFQFCSTDSWYKTRFSKSDKENLFDIRLGASINLFGITLDQAISIVRPIVEVVNTLG